MFKRLSTVLALSLFGLFCFTWGQQSRLVNYDAASRLDFGAAQETWGIVFEKYLRGGEVDEEELRYGLAKGLVDALDDVHSAFLAPEEARSFLLSLQGDLEGIGAELRLQDGLLMVVNPLPGSPAEKAGIRPGDIILKVDGKPLGEVKNLLEVVMQIRGEKGSEVVLTVIHQDSDGQSEDIAIIRDKIHIEAVTWEEVDSSTKPIAHLELAAFTEEAGPEFLKALKEIQNEDISRLILDLRYNGGGYLDGAIEISSAFLEGEQPVVHIQDKNEIETRNSLGASEPFQGDIVVLINDSSASASEIVTGVLQDYDIAHVIGTKSFGKGSVQEVLPLSDASLLRLTIAEWLTPEKRSIEGEGLEPDQVVELDFDAYLEGDDNQLDAAIEYLEAL